MTSIKHLEHFVLLDGINSIFRLINTKIAYLLFSFLSAFFRAIVKFFGQRPAGTVTELSPFIRARVPMRLRNMSSVTVQWRHISSVLTV